MRARPFLVFARQQSKACRTAFPGRRDGLERPSCGRLVFALSIVAVVLGVSGPAIAQQTTASDLGGASSAAATAPGGTSTSGAPAAQGGVGSTGLVPAATPNPVRGPAAEDAIRSAGTAPTSPSPRPPADPIPRRSVTRVTSGNGALPNESGQLYREYDISPYTARITTTKRPEQAIVDWVLRETGYEAWHGEPLAILSAAPRTLRVYHTAQVQAVVAEIVDRFNSSEAEAQAFSLRVITVDSPNWRVRVQRLLKPVPIQSQGAQAWLLEKEGAAAVLAELRRRSDYREHNSPQLLVNNGQPTVVSAVRGRNYVRSVKLRADVWPGFEPDSAIVDEGFSLEFIPLLSTDGKTVDAAMRCHIDQVERMLPVMLDVPTVAAPRQRTKTESPQIVQYRFHERFRWPVDQVLMIGMGVVPVPVPGEAKPLVPGLPLPISNGPPRADLLVLVESKGKAAPQAPRVTRETSAGNGFYRAR